jgi:hypothetical protein
MIGKSSGGPDPSAANDQEPYAFSYGHGRMPVFLKIVWVAAIVFITWYIVKFLLTSVGAELVGR